MDDIFGPPTSAPAASTSAASSKPTSPNVAVHRSSSADDPLFDPFADPVAPPPPPVTTQHSNTGVDDDPFSDFAAPPSTSQQPAATVAAQQHADPEQQQESAVVQAAVQIEEVVAVVAYEDDGFGDFNGAVPAVETAPQAEQEQPAVRAATPQRVEAQVHPEPQQQQEVEAHENEIKRDAPEAPFAEKHQEVTDENGNDDVRVDDDADAGFGDFAEPVSNVVPVVQQQQERQEEPVHNEGEDGFGDFAEPVSAPALSPPPAPQKQVQPDDEDDGFGDFNEANPAQQQQQEMQQQEQSPQHHQGYNSEPILPPHEALQCALSEMSRFCRVEQQQQEPTTTAFLINTSNARGLLSSRTETVAAEERQQEEEEDAFLASTVPSVVEPGQFRAGVAALVANVLAATHRGALVGTVADAIEHEKRSAGRVRHVLPVIGRAARALDMEQFLSMVCF